MVLVDIQCIAISFDVQLGLSQLLGNVIDYNTSHFWSVESITITQKTVIDCNRLRLGEGGVQSRLFFASSTAAILCQAQTTSKFVTQESNSINTILCQNMKISPFSKHFTINLKRVLSLSSVPHAWGTLDTRMGYT